MTSGSFNRMFQPRPEIIDSIPRINAQQYRTEIVAQLYELDGRKDPSHPFHGVVTGCGRPFTRLIELEDLVAELAARVKALEAQLKAQASEGSPPLKVRFDDPVSSLRLQSRTISTLRRNGILTIGSLINRTAINLLQFRGFGDVQLQDVNQALGDLGLTLSAS